MSAVDIIVDGRTVSTTAGVTVAAVLIDAAVQGFRVSVSGEPRAPVCGMGVCYECRVTIDGISHQRACLAVVAPGMRIGTESRA